MVDLPNLPDQTWDTYGYASFLMSLRTAADASTQWLSSVQWAIIPFHGSWQSQVEGSAVDRNGNVFACGNFCNGDANDAEPPCVGAVAKFAAADGTSMFTRTYNEFDRVYNIEYDEQDDLLFLSAPMLSSSPSGALGIDCSDSPSHCAVTACVDPSDGTILWARTVHGAPGFAFTGEVKLAKPSDGYVLHGKWRNPFGIWLNAISLVCFRQLQTLYLCYSQASWTGRCILSGQRFLVCSLCGFVWSDNPRILNFHNQSD